jgi:GNAT superfamily N-acetyltransferase
VFVAVKTMRNEPHLPTSPSLSIRAATPDDASEVSALLEASYTKQLADDYPPDVLARALPLMTKANPRLLASGTYYVVEADIHLVGCGGWSKEAPGSHKVTDGTGHIRHVATHPEWLRKGVGRTLLSHCCNEAAMAGMKHLECHSTLSAVNFYAVTGFTIVGPLEMKLAPEIFLPGVLLRRDLLKGEGLS